MKLKFNRSAMCKESEELNLLNIWNRHLFKKYLGNSKTRSLRETCCSCDSVMWPAEILGMLKSLLTFSQVQPKQNMEAIL